MLSGENQDEATLEKIIEQEIKALHNFISAWFRGDVEQSELLFRQELAERLAPTFINIQPSGDVLSAQDLLIALHDGYASNEDFKIEISDCEVHFVERQSGLVLAAYVEHQWGAKNTTPPHNLRRSTVLFELAEQGERPFWHHIHETRLAD